MADNRHIMTTRTDIQAKSGFIIDMDGVLYHGNRLLAGAGEFIAWLQFQEKKFLFLTNSSERSPRELSQKLERLGISVGEEHFFTSALATAAFLHSQCPNGSAYVIGDAGLIHALYAVGFSMNEINPDYVVVGETRTYNYDKITHAIRLVLAGAKLIGTNPDVSGPAADGLVPATGALMTPIELVTGSRAYYVGKPNPLIMRQALKTLGCQREQTVIVGDRMDTDIIAGIEAGIETVLVLSGVTAETDLTKFAYRPNLILQGVGEIVGSAMAP